MADYRKLLMIAGTAWLFDAMDVGLLSFVMLALQKDWGLSSIQLAWIGSINSIGMAAGAFLFGFLADRIGRKLALILSIVVFSFGSGLTALVSTLSSLMVLRFIMGAGLGGELPVASTLVSESVAAEKRGRVIVLLESFWAVGWILAAIIAYFVVPDYGWRAAMVLGAVPALYAVYLRFHLPDSPKYQSNAPKPRVLETVGILWSGVHRKDTLMLWILWFCVAFSYYGMFLWLPSVVGMKGFSLIKSFEYVLIMTLAQLPGYFTAAWLVEKIGRKMVLGVYLLGTAVSAAFFGAAESVSGLLVAGAFLSFFNLGAWGALYAYTPEQYPTRIRGAGAGMASAIGRIGGMLGPLMIGFLIHYQFSTQMVFSLFCASIIIGVGALALLGRETRNIELV